MRIPHLALIIGFAILPTIARSEDSPKCENCVKLESEIANLKKQLERERVIGMGMLANLQAEADFNETLGQMDDGEKAELAEQVAQFRKSKKLTLANSKSLNTSGALRLLAIRSPEIIADADAKAVPGGDELLLSRLRPLAKELIGANGADARFFVVGRHALAEVRGMPAPKNGGLR